MELKFWRLSFQERIGITVGTFVMAYNILLYVLCGFVMESWILPLYFIVTYWAALKIFDFIVEGIDRSKAAMIIAGKPDKICGALSEAFECGMTLTRRRQNYDLHYCE